MSRMSLPTPTLHAARLRLRPLTSADADALFALHSNAYVLRYWDAPPWSERARAERFIVTCRQMAEEGSGRLAMDRVSDGAFIGWCGLTRWNPDYRSASMGYCLDDAAWGHSETGTGISSSSSASESNPLGLFSSARSFHTAARHPLTAALRARWARERLRDMSAKSDPRHSPRQRSRLNDVEVDEVDDVATSKALAGQACSSDGCLAGWTDQFGGSSLPESSSRSASAAVAWILPDAWWTGA